EGTRRRVLYLTCPEPYCGYSEEPAGPLAGRSGCAPPRSVRRSSRTAETVRRERQMARAPRAHRAGRIAFAGVGSAGRALRLPLNHQPPISMNSKQLTGLLLLAGLVCGSSVASAQTNPPPSVDLPLAHDTGWVRNVEAGG